MINLRRYKPLEDTLRELFGSNLKEFGWTIEFGNSYSVIPENKIIITSSEYEEFRRDFFRPINYAKMAFLSTKKEYAKCNIDKLMSVIYPQDKWDFDIVDEFVVIKNDDNIYVVKVSRSGLNGAFIDFDHPNYEYTICGNLGTKIPANEVIARSKFMKVQEIKLISMSESGDISLNNDGTVMIPKGYCKDKHIMWVHILIDTPTLKKIEIGTIYYQENNDVVEKSCLHTTVSLRDGKIYIDREDASYPGWMNHIHTSLDFVKNPLNREAWKTLTDEPAYIGADLFVTSDERPYIHMNGAWIPASREWIKKHPHLPETIAYEYQLYKGVRNSI